MCKPVSPSFNKTFTSDAYQCKTWHMLQFLQRRNKYGKEDVSVTTFYKAFRPRPLTSFDFRPSLSFGPNERPQKVT